MNPTSKLLVACLALPAIMAVRTALAAGPDLGISIRDGWTRVTTKPDSVASGFFTLHNGGATPDLLLGVTCPVARRTTIHDAAGHALRNLKLRPGETLRLSPNGPHLLLTHTHFQFYPRALIPCSATFREAGTMMIYLHVEPKSYHGAAR